MPEEIKLEPCPWCQSTNIQVEFVGVRFSYGCDTEFCYGFQSTTEFPTKEQAAKAWNTRALPARSAVEISETAYLIGLLTGALRGTSLQVDAELKSRIETILKRVDEFNAKYFKTL